MAMHNYHETYRRFPPAAVCGLDGKPLLSWRVVLLPFLEEGGLYDQFHLDEPWDSPHNIELLPKMPIIYGPYRNTPTKDGMTYFQAFVGPGAAFEGTTGLTFADFKDGTSNTFMIVEAWERVPWTKPEDLIFDPNGPLPRLGGIMKDGSFRALFADGHVQDMPQGVREDTVRAFITRN